MTTVAQNSYVDVTDLITITNNSPKTLHWFYESREFVIDPGKSRSIPFFLAVKELGDPRSQPGKAQAINIRGVIHHVPAREGELGRLCCLYGLPAGAVDDLPKKVPNVTIKDQSGQVIQMVIDDPKGISYLPASPEQINERDLLEARLKQLEARLSALDNAPPQTVDAEPAEYDVEEDAPPDYSSTFRVS